MIPFLMKVMYALKEKFGRINIKLLLSLGGDTLHTCAVQKFLHYFNNKARHHFHFINCLKKT